MRDLDRTAIIHRQATAAEPLPVLTIAAPYHRKADLIILVRRRAARGELRPIDPAPYWNARAGQWEQRAIRLQDPAPAWIRPAAITLFALAGISLLAGLLWWVLSVLTASALALFLIAALFALAVIVRSGRRQTVNITNNVTMR